MITFGCKGCQRRKELIRGYWVILRTTVTKLLSEKKG